jgi:hypothetical protein
MLREKGSARKPVDILVKAHANCQVFREKIYNGPFSQCIVGQTRFSADGVDFTFLSSEADGGGPQRDGRAFKILA